MEPSAQERAFAAEVERHRTAAHVTQDWVAQQVGLSRSKVSEVCGARYLPNRQVLDAMVTALAMDRERAVALWKAAWDGRRERLRTARTTAESPPDDWSSLPVLPAEVRSLLKAQEVAARDMPYKLPGARTPSLDTVYVRQELSTASEETRDEQVRTEPELDERGFLHERAAPKPRLTVRPPARTVHQALDGDDHILVTGGPGQGKSTLSLRLAGEIAARWSGDDAPPPLSEPVIPLRLTAGTLATRLDIPFPQALVDGMRAEYGSLLWSEVSPEQVGRRVAGCRWLLLVDGLDEVADPADQSRLVHVLERCAAPGSPYRVVVTTRPIDGSVLVPLQRASAVRYELQPFDQQALRDFAHNWFDTPDEGDRFLRQLHEAHLGELVTVPLLATIAAIIWEEYGNRPLPDNQYELYESYLAYLTTAHPTAPSLFDAVRVPLLEHLGRVRLESDSSLLAAARAWVAERLPTPIGWTDALTTFLTAAGPLVFRADDLAFLHHSFAEHLAATSQARDLPTAFTAEAPAFSALAHTALQGDRGRHAKAVLLHYTRLHPDQADDVVRSLHAGGATHHVLAASLLAKHAPVSADVLEGFLATTRKWAMTTEYRVVDILGHVSRAAHHPGLVPWLVDLMRNDRAPWPSRVEAAIALGTRLRTTHAPEAIALLCAVTDDTTVTVNERLNAAEALSGCGTAERKAAEQGLLAVLNDPNADVHDCRTAAIVLASLGPECHTTAVAALSALLDDPFMPNADLVTIATGLLEVDFAFHDRCAEVFLSVLHDRVDSMDGRRNAALALASLGTQYLERGATVLTDLVTQRSIWRHKRIQAAEVLAELGPRHRLAAAEQLRAMMAEPDMHHTERRSIVEVLVDLGACGRDQAANWLRGTVDEPDADANSLYWTARTLADLGPEYHDEAVRLLLRVIDDPLADGSDRAGALDRLAEFGGLHRATAVRHLLADLEERGADPGTRVNAAHRLAQLGPEFHEAVVDNLVDVLGDDLSEHDASSAWRLLASLDMRYADIANKALLDLVQADLNAQDRQRVSYLTSPEVDTKDADEAADISLRVLADTSASPWTRRKAANNLVRLHRRFHAPLLTTVVSLMDADPQLLHKAELLSPFESTARVVRVRLAAHIRASIGASTDAGAVVSGGKLLLSLGQADQTLAPLLHGIMLDTVVDVTTRAEAAVLRATLDPAYLAEAVEIAASQTGWSWHYFLDHLSKLGADVTDHAIRRVTGRDVDHHGKQAAAQLIAELHGRHIDESVHELRSQAADPHLSVSARLEAHSTLARFQTPAIEAVTFLKMVFDDEDASVDDRCQAANRLIQMDRSHWKHCTDELERLLLRPLITLDEQATLIDRLDRLKAFRKVEYDRLNLAVAHHPSVSAQTRRNVLAYITNQEADIILRDILADPATPVSMRVRENRGMKRPADEIAGEVLTAVESTWSDRIIAAGASADSRHLLVEWSSDPTLRIRAWRQLVRQGTSYRRDVIADAQGLLADDGVTPHVRFRVVEFLADRMTPLPTAAVAFLRGVLADDHASTRQQLKALHLLRDIAALDRIRAVRDDEHSSPAARWLASTTMIDYEVDDRARGAAALRSIATDLRQRPAMRCAAARDLARFGVGGRRQAADAAYAMMEDEGLPTMSRAHAASIVAKTAISRRRDVVRLLEGLCGVENPRHRLRVLQALAVVAPLTAAHRLREMVRDRHLPAGVRVRCAEMLVKTHRGYRESAVIAVREVAVDDGVPRHIRVRAAQRLARWSEVLRNEARSTLCDLQPERQTAPSANAFARHRGTSGQVG
ncbi:XRE family transcriptional regulator [Saccharothrix variisporea]|uniref:Helix-turn-helix protein n=1 Tax=Saccharothrix variisporea TaxID=543527 RepID=A0A495XNH8_9PSEU|nr:XRE family transcriptional regulator [Saccharothrix variisporea]RKT74464.1 helix-turn-helix protein [Saccharothrix variisporea]